MNFLMVTMASGIARGRVRTTTTTTATTESRKMAAILQVIIYVKKLLDSDWLRAVQFKCNTSAKSVTPVQKV